MSAITVQELADILSAADYVILAPANGGQPFTAGYYDWDDDDESENACYIIGSFSMNDVRLPADATIQRRMNGGFTFNGFVGTLYAVKIIKEEE